LTDPGYILPFRNYEHNFVILNQMMSITKQCMINLTTLDLDTLQTLAVAIELGSFRRAAEHLRRTPSAISLQMKRLQEDVGVRLFRKSGRGIELTEAGEIVLRYSQRMLALNEELLDTVRGASLGGTVRVGFSQDFAETVLPVSLSRFAKFYPLIQIEVRIEPGENLVAAVNEGKLDMALVMGEANRTSAQILGELELGWIASHDYRPFREQAIPLILLGSQCAFRRRATAVLDEAEIPWRTAVIGPSVAAAWASAIGGLGITARSSLGLPKSLVWGKNLFDLPQLGTIPITLHTRRQRKSRGLARLQEIIKETLYSTLRELHEHDRNETTS
jgi:DNA-binding transcriptional LysR family regulator